MYNSLSIKELRGGGWPRRRNSLSLNDLERDSKCREYPDKGNRKDGDTEKSR